MKKILLIDDSGLILRNMKALIEENFEVAMAVSGKTALAALERSRPDLIFLDYEMPEMDGIETLENIRAIAEYKDIPVVFLTGVDTPDVVDKIIATGCDGYLLKPAKRDVLFETIDRILS